MKRTPERNGCVKAWLLAAALAGAALAAPAVPGQQKGAGEDRAWLGVFLDDEVDGGVRLVALVPGGPAELAGLRPGDIVIGAGNAQISDVAEFTITLRGFRPGMDLELQLLRSGQALARAVRLADWTTKAIAPPPLLAPPSPPLPVLAPAPARRCEDYGLYLATVPAELRAHLGAPPEAGLLVRSIDPDRPAAAAGFRVGDVLVSLGKRPVRGLDDVERMLGRQARSDEALVAALVRDRKPTEIRIEGGTTVTRGSTLRAAEALEEYRRQVAEQVVRQEIERLRARIRQLERELESLDPER